MTCKRKDSFIRRKGTACQRKSGTERALARRSRTRKSLAKKCLIRVSVKRPDRRRWSLWPDFSDGIPESSSSGSFSESTVADDDTECSWWIDNEEDIMMTDSLRFFEKQDKNDSSSGPDSNNSSEEQGINDHHSRPSNSYPREKDDKNDSSGSTDKHDPNRMPGDFSVKCDKKASILDPNNNDFSKGSGKNVFNEITNKNMSSQMPDNQDFGEKVDIPDTDWMKDKKDCRLRDENNKSSAWSDKFDSTVGPGNPSISFGGNEFTRRPYKNDTDRKTVDSECSEKQDKSSIKWPANMGSSGTPDITSTKNGSSPRTASNNPGVRADFVARFEKNDCRIWAFNDFRWRPFSNCPVEWPGKTHTSRKPDKSGSWRLHSGRPFFCPHKCDLCEALAIADTIHSKDSGDFLRLRPDDSWRRPEGDEFLWGSSEYTPRAERMDFIKSPDCRTDSGDFLRLRQDDSWRRPGGSDFPWDSSECTSRAWRDFIKRADSGTKTDCNIPGGRLDNTECHRNVPNERNEGVPKSGNKDSGTKPDTNNSMWRPNNSHARGRPENRQFCGSRINTNTNKDNCEPGSKGASVRLNNSDCRWKYKSDSVGTRGDSDPSRKLTNSVCSGGYHVHFTKRPPARAFTGQSQARSVTRHTFSRARSSSARRMPKEFMKMPQKSFWIRYPNERVCIPRSQSRTRVSSAWLSSFHKRPHQGRDSYRAPSLHQPQQEATAPVPESRVQAQQRHHLSITAPSPDDQGKSKR
ncbi:hypothetical protein NDU88_008935 [Pleurodeles waltl]|uniref:Uncharacterized protein n=1 Tax=Pleurodeles waltl TaxID=8319 RepID=A0AAV7PTL3_PLEWA|nr:hypothetical protein NDU88_008935 [Pleurodeles waltl]